jgi:hypothetical protein
MVDCPHAVLPLAPPLTVWVLLSDDLQLVRGAFRDGGRVLLDAEPDIEVWVRPPTVSRAVAETRRLRPPLC